jgi:hypothetical protein
MDFKLSLEASKRAFDHLKRNTPYLEALRDTASIGLNLLPALVRQEFDAANFETAADELMACVVELFKSDPPADDINGLWFGLVEMITDDEADDAELHEDELTTTEMILYITGSADYELGVDDPDWPCDVSWEPEERYFSIQLTQHISRIRQLHGFDEQWIVDIAILEPLVILTVGTVVRNLGPDILLGTADHRAIGTGFDSGDLNEVGILTREGFQLADEIKASLKQALADHEEDLDTSDANDD